nr:hypothetical protein [Mycobacterium uberis]
MSIRTISADAKTFGVRALGQLGRKLRGTRELDVNADARVVRFELAADLSKRRL